MNTYKSQTTTALVIGMIQMLSSAILHMVSLQLEPDFSTHFIAQSGNILFVASLIAMIAAIHSYLHKQADDEKLSESSIDRSNNLFDEELSISGRFQNSFRQFNKVVLPVVLILLSLIEAGLTYRVMHIDMTHAHNILPQNLSPMLSCTSLYIVLTCIFFLAGKYCSGIAQAENRLYLISVGSYSLFSAFVCMVGAIVSLLFYWQFPTYAAVSTWVMCTVSFLIATERVMVLVVDLYRPQSAATVDRPVYISRVLALIFQPQNLLANLSEMIHYQFGIRISERWLLNTIRQAVVPYLLVQIVTLVLLTCIIYIQPEETGLKETIGSKNLEKLAPGIYLSGPWPFTRIHKVPTSKVHQFNAGSRQGENDKKRTSRDNAVQLWQNDNETNQLFLVGNGSRKKFNTEKRTDLISVNLMAAGITVHYKITDSSEFTTNHVTATELLQYLSRRSLNRYLLVHDFNVLLRNELNSVRRDLRAEIQRAATTRRLGIQILNVDIDYLQPPPQIATIYQNVIDAQQSSSSNRLAAERYAIEILSEAEYEMNRIVKEAESETTLTTSLAAVEKDNFVHHYKIYRQYPELFRVRETMDHLESWLRNVRKVVTNSENAREVITLELKESRPDLLSIPVVE